MKDILIAVAPRSEKHREICNRIATEITAQKIPLQRPLETAFLTSGPKSFEGAMLIRDICLQDNLLFAIFEIESVLFAPTEN